MEKLEGTITDLNEQLVAKEKIVADQAKIIETNQKQMYKTDVLLKDQKMEIDKISKELATVNVRYRKLHEESGQLRDGFEEAKKEIKNKRNEIKVNKSARNCVCIKYFRLDPHRRNAVSQK